MSYEKELQELGNTELFALISLVGVELGISPTKMAKLTTEAVLGVQRMKLDQQHAEPPQFPEEEL